MATWPDHDAKTFTHLRVRPSASLEPDAFGQHPWRRRKRSGSNAGLGLTFQAGQRLVREVTVIPAARERTNVIHRADVDQGIRTECREEARRQTELKLRQRWPSI